MDQLTDEDYECFTCEQIFRHRVFSISQEWERIDFNGEIPSIEIKEAYGLESATAAKHAQPQDGTW